MEPDRGTDTRQAGRSRPHWRRQSTFCRCHRVDGANGNSVARSLTVLRELEQRVQAIPPMAKAGVWERILEALADPDLESVIIDGTIIRVHQHAAGGKGGFKNKRSGDRVAA